MRSPVPPRVLAFDFSLTRTGYALVDGTPGVLRPDKGFQAGAARLGWIRDKVDALCKPWNEKPDVVVFEGYAYARTNQAHQLGELGGVVRLALHEAGMRAVVIAPSILKRYATGKGNADKKAVLVAAVKRLGYDGSDDNEADALWLRALAMDAYGWPVVDMPKAQRDASVAAVTWPRLARAGDDEETAA